MTDLSMHRPVIRNANFSLVMIAILATLMHSTLSKTLAFQPNIYPTAIRRCSPQTNTLTRRNSILQVNDNAVESKPNVTPNENAIPSRTAFIKQVTDFLTADSIPYRQLSTHEIHNVLQSYSQSHGVNTTTLMEWAHARTVLLVGQNHNDTSSVGFILNLCPTLSLSEIHAIYIQINNGVTSVSQAVASYAWVNAHLTNAFSSSNSYRNIIHLHQDTWHSNPTLIKSRIRAKLSNLTRIYARKTFVRRISKLEYMPFLQCNHLWGATKAKFAYGLYYNCTSSQAMQHGEEERLVAVATFSSKRIVSRSNHTFHSYELLRFCTLQNTMVVGGLSKLISGFVNDIIQQNSNSNYKGGVDIVTSIDRDFGNPTGWPNFQVVNTMDPLPMFVGVDGVRRHAVGMGLVPCGLFESLSGGRAGLPDKLIEELDRVDVGCDAWEMVGNKGFYPVFDAGVARLMCVVRYLEGGERLNITELWEQSEPRFVSEHYSKNKGIREMLRCIREKRV